ncbi:Regulator of telomere elongation helicase 1-like protein [Drosera capensis]
MPIYKIRGIEVDFPYEAYDCQIVYMEKVIQSLQQGFETPKGSGKRSHCYDNRDEPMHIWPALTPHLECNALLESPTGTGKTLCLLCATLAWRKSLGPFSSRKSNGDAQKLNDDGLGPSQSDGLKPPMIVYASRTHSQLRQVVQELRRTNYRCPYYLARELHKVVDILLVPYNYLIERRYKDLLNIEWRNSVLIFDEAHNLESICADAASFDLTSGLLTACIAEAKNCIDMSLRRREIHRSNDKKCNPDNFAILRGLLLKLEKRISELHIDSKELGFTRPGPYIYELLADLNITSKSANKLIDMIEEAALLLEEGVNADGGESQEMKGVTCRSMYGNLKQAVEILAEIWAGVLPAGPSGHSFNSSYRSRDSPEYKRDLGNAIGYVQDYMSKLKDSSTSGAVFFAVCRGKYNGTYAKDIVKATKWLASFSLDLVSEGLDFTDHAGRAVVITGLPFPTRNDPKVRLKREFLDHLAKPQTSGAKGKSGMTSKHLELSTRQLVVLSVIGMTMCYSKFGDVVYSLTRFFRDAVQHPIMLERARLPYSVKADLSSYFLEFHMDNLYLVSQTADICRIFAGNLDQANASHPSENFSSVKSFSEACSDVENCCKLPSPFNGVKSGNASTHLGEILPANLSSLSAMKQNQSLVLKHVTSLFKPERKLLPPQILSPCKSSEVVTLSKTFSLEGKPNEEPLPFSCRKRPKILKGEAGGSLCEKASQEVTLSVEKLREGNISASANPLKQEKIEASMTTAPGDSVVGSSSQVISEMKSQTKLRSAANPGSSASPVSSQGEAKGSGFLYQVKEKLSPTEYGEFVGYMKALKSKAMKIGPVLHSIVRLFSTPERLPLLRSSARREHRNAASSLFVLASIISTIDFLNLSYGFSDVISTTMQSSPGKVTSDDDIVFVVLLVFVFVVVNAPSTDARASSAREPEELDATKKRWGLYGSFGNE